MELPPLDDALERARAGDDSALAEVFRALQPRLLRFLHARAGSAAEDLASETWLSAMRSFTSFVGDADDFRAWLFTIARRRVADHFRSAGRRPVSVPLEDREGEEIPPASAVSTEDLALDALSASEAAAALVTCLTTEQAEVILLRVVADLDTEQVATVTGRSPGAVRILQMRALRKLSRNFAPGPVTP